MKELQPIYESAIIVKNRNLFTIAYTPYIDFFSTVQIRGKSVIE